ncbi:Gamma-glutamylcyclotransferase [uncultured Gammaproteobacteria bacterium]
MSLDHQTFILSPDGHYRVVAGDELWVFAYGSLMWHPGFAFLECCQGRLIGYHRAFCVYSYHYRGTPEQPGLVLGLDVGGECEGIAFRIAADEVATTLEHLWRREMISNVYRPLPLMVRLAPDGREITACAFVVDRDHIQYCSGLNLEQAAAVIRCGHGHGGANLDYLNNTVEHLDQLGITDPSLHDLLAEASRSPHPPYLHSCPHS